MKVYDFSLIGVSDDINTGSTSLSTTIVCFIGFKGTERLVCLVMGFLVVFLTIGSANGLGPHKPKLASSDRGLDV